jgi:hypothetical protein
VNNDILYRHEWVQRAIDDYDSQLIGASAGLGSGKTSGATDWLDDRIALNSNCPFWFFMMPIYQKIHDAAIPKFRELYQNLNLQEGKDFKIVKSPFPKIVYPNGQEIHFISANRPDKILAVEYGGGVISEAGSTRKEAIKNARDRIRDKRSKTLQCLLEGVPQGMTYFSDLFDSDTQDGWNKSRKRDHIKRYQDDRGHWMQLRRFRLTTYDNERFLPAGYISNLLDNYKGLNAYIQAYIHGIFTPLVEGNAYSNYKSLHDCPDVDPDPYLDINLCWDFNANPLAWASIQRFPYTEYGERRFSYKIVHEANEGFNQLDEAVAEFAVKHPVTKFSETTIKLYGDRSGHAGSHKIKGSDFEAIEGYLKELGYRNVQIEATKQVAPEAASVEAVQRLFLNNLLFICQRCKMVRRSFLSTKWRDGQRKLDKPAGETHTHHSDGVKYWAWQTTRNETGKQQIFRAGINRT